MVLHKAWSAMRHSPIISDREIAQRIHTLDENLRSLANTTSEHDKDSPRYQDCIKWIKRQRAALEGLRVG